ncbi:hypothetical protein MML48_9g00000296 [Holotrichia oblita]|uniref:Uncharacterized protein n=1 Tax=Holotrichia oblita TaxID=644536 RepID=A0ACB9SKM9_HOLOL|nr:hypothetical protein MML48_9g00000296 [Holotrichia oblita]
MYFKRSTNIDILGQSSEQELSPDRQFCAAIVDFPTPKRKRIEEHYTPKAKKLKLQLQRSSRNLQNKRAQISKLKQRLRFSKKYSSIENILNLQKFASNSSKVLTKMQFKTKRRAWTTDEKKFALTFYYKSPAAYRFLRSQKVILPGITTIKRWIGTSKFKPEIISGARAAVTENDLRIWFADLEAYLNEENATDILNNPDRIFNADETEVQLCPKTGKVLGPKQCKNFYDIAVGQEKESTTVLANFSASGKITPPCIVYPYKRIPRDVVASIPNYFTIIGRSDTGWMVGPTFFEYVANSFHKWLLENNIELRILFLLDGHTSHINPELADFCREKRILIYCLLASATHIIQPCDVEVFRSLKCS